MYFFSLRAYILGVKRKIYFSIRLIKQDSQETRKLVQKQKMASIKIVSFFFQISSLLFFFFDRECLKSQSRMKFVQIIYIVTDLAFATLAYTVNIVPVKEVMLLLLATK